MYFNYYEKQNKLASISSIMDIFNLNCILCNNIIEVEPEKIEKISYVNFENIDAESKEDIYHNYLCFSDHVDFDTIEDFIKQDIESEYNYSYIEYFQYYIIPENEINYWNLIGHDIFYHEVLDIFFMGIPHMGTAWDYVLTDIPLLEKDTDVFDINIDYIHENLKQLI